MAVNFSKGIKAPSNAGGVSKPLPSFMKQGAAGKKAIEDDEKAKKDRSVRIWRFWMANDTETQLTFLDGNLDADSLLDCLIWDEHNLQIAGKWGNFFTCVRGEELCPICEQSGDPYLAAGFTVIDHTPYKSAKTGKIIKDTIKSYVCKPDTLKILQKLAIKRGGLAGCTFDVSRTGDQSANVGNMFDFVEKRSMADLQAQYGSLKKGEEKLIQPIDFATFVSYKTADELRALGFGTPVLGSGDQYKGSL